jgi:hypothetical protein
MSHIVGPRNLIQEVISACGKAVDKLEKQDQLPSSVLVNLGHESHQKYVESLCK